MAANRSNPQQEIERLKTQREEKTRKLESPRASMKGEGKVCYEEGVEQLSGYAPGAQKDMTIREDASGRFDYTTAVEQISTVAHRLMDYNLWGDKTWRDRRF